MSSSESKLIGKWHLDKSNFEAFKEYGDTTIEFTSNNDLIYRIHDANKTQIILLEYSIDKNKLITNQPSALKKEITEFYITSDDKLILREMGILKRQTGSNRLFLFGCCQLSSTFV